jgi:hypothetical protein
VGQTVVRVRQDARVIDDAKLAFLFESPPGPEVDPKELADYLLTVVAERQPIRAEQVEADAAAPNLRQ